jgi:hypothetical protein
MSAAKRVSVQTAHIIATATVHIIATALTGTPPTRWATGNTAPDGYYQHSDNPEQARKELRLAEIERGLKRRVRRVS